MTYCWVNKPYSDQSVHSVQAAINRSYWMGVHPISLDIGLVLLVFGSSYGLTQIQHRLVQYPVILDGYPFNEKFIVYRKHHP